MQHREGQDRQYGKESAQRAQKLAEKPALYCHPDQNQDQADDSGEVVRGRQFQGGEPGKYVPGAGPMQGIHQACCCHKDNEGKIQVFQFLQDRECLRGQ